jgi:hypothetical protein
VHDVICRAIVSNSDSGIQENRFVGGERVVGVDETAFRCFEVGLREGIRKATKAKGMFGDEGLNRHSDLVNISIS